MEFLSTLQSIQDAQTADFPLSNPETGDPVCILVMAGPNHPSTKALDSKRAQRLQAAAARARDPQKAMQKEYTQALDLDASRERTIEVLIARTVGWKNADGSPSDKPFDAAAREALYRQEDKGWLRNEVAKFLAADDSFTKSSQPKSLPTASVSIS